MEEQLSLSFEDTQSAFVYKSDKDLKKAYRMFSLMRSGFLVKLGSIFAPLALKLKVPIKGLIRHTIFQQFCGGENLKEAAQTATSLHQYGVRCALDYGVEASAGEDNYDRSVIEYQKAIQYAGKHRDIPFISIKITGFARTTMLQKFSEEKSFCEKEEAEWQRATDRIRAVCKTAYENDISVLIDAEESWIQLAVDTIAQQMMILFNYKKITVYNTFQLYRHDRLNALKEHWQYSRDNNCLLGAKLVRGAYMEKERDRAEEMGYPSPIQPNKAATDEDYDQAVFWCLEHIDTLSVFIGTHNEKSCMLAAQFLHEHEIPHNHPHVHFSQLFGMSDNITFNLAKVGYNISKYLPYGPVKDVLPYLIRRSQENSSISDQMGRELMLLHEEIERRKAG